MLQKDGIYIDDFSSRAGDIIKFSFPIAKIAKAVLSSDRLAIF
jgi:hypothetical protein